ncbi:hypothetical protein ACFIQF_18625 [Comamonas sp. J-3]|uniref:hypothetical protein n=1 Tax=Comamonas trifloxystrobinivorans TaxID=3350256 RepID=UPI003728DCFA
MSYTTRQVQSLLTQAELELFQASRATAIKAFTVRQLEAKIKRARALRNKFRDLHQRQVVRTGASPATARKPMGGENARTEVKAEVMQEVLSRFEAQLEKAQNAPAKKKAPAKAAASKRTGSVRASGGADIAMRGTQGTTARQLARSKRSAADEALDAVQARGAKSNRAAAGKTAVKKTASKTAVKKTAAKTAAKTIAKTATKAAGKTATKSAAKKAAKKAASKPATKSVTGLVKAVRKAVAKKSATSAAPKKASKGKAGKSLVSGSASDKAKGAVPTSMPASAARKNPLKAKPVNKKIHASARSRTRANEAKRDSR